MSKNIHELVDEFSTLSSDEKTKKIAKGHAKLQAALGFSDEKFSGYVAATDHAFKTLAIMTQEGLLLPEQSLALVAILADVGMGRPAVVETSLH